MRNMANILLLETATPVCSVVLAEDGKNIAHRESSEQNAHSSCLSVFIDEVMKEAGMDFRSLDAVCISSGPGSYTGLRIGTSTGKGLCYALGKPLLSVETLQGMANWFLKENPDYQGLVCPMIDARRMEVYTAMFDSDGNRLTPTTAEIIDENSFSDFLKKGRVAFIGDGAEKTKTLLSGNANAVYDMPFEISAEGLLAEAERELQCSEFEDVAYFEPFYLKDFVAAKPVVKGLR